MLTWSMAQLVQDQGCCLQAKIPRLARLQMPSLTPIFISWHQSQHQSMPRHSNQHYSHSQQCVFCLFSPQQPPPASREEPPSAIPISGALRVYPLQIRDSQDRSHSRLAAEIKGQVIVAPVDPSQGRLCLPCHSSPPATTTAPTRWSMLAISLPTPTVPGQFPSCCP